MNINQRLAEELKIELWQVEAAVKLIDEGNTIPFISRYRKELNKKVKRKSRKYTRLFLFTFFVMNMIMCFFPAQAAEADLKAGD